MKTFDTVAKLKLAKLKEGQFVETGGYYAKGDGGAARYLIVTPQSFDGYGDHELANGNVAVLQVGLFINIEQYGALADDMTTDYTNNVQAAIDYCVANQDTKLTGNGKSYRHDGELSITNDLYWCDTRLEHYGSNTNAVMVSTGSNNYLKLDMSNIRINGTNSTAWQGLSCEKTLRSSWIDVHVTNFTKVGAVGVLRKGCTSNRHWNCRFDLNYKNMEFRGFTNPSGGAQVPVNENKFFGCNFNQSVSDSVTCNEDPSAGGIKSSGNGNGFISCWLEDNGGRGITAQNIADWTIFDTRFESNTTNSINIENTAGGTTINRILSNNFSALDAPDAHVRVDANVRGTRVNDNKFDSIHTPIINLGVDTTRSGNRTDGTANDLEDIISAEDATINTAKITTPTLLSSKFTDRANGNGWVEYTIASGAITWNGEACIEVDTEATSASDDLSTINGGSNGDMLIIRAKDNARTVNIPTSTGTIRVPSGGISISNIFAQAIFINDGFGRWNLLSFSDNA